MQQERLGPYEIGEQIGKGGMGSVFRAVHIETGEVAAVKALAPHLGMAEGFRERFEAEVESLKKLRHECIVRLYGYGEQDGVLFYAMELVEGTSLEDEIKAGRRFSWREVTEISIQVCRALKHAHDHGVVHRDIKPANLLIDSSNRVKIADFGIARLFGGTQLTSVGGVLGTADYMSPEQADGRAVTEKCDQYGLGGVIFALLAGRPPFRAKSLPEMLQLQRFAEPEPIRRFVPETPVQLEQVVTQLLSKSPSDRFPNVLILRRHLEAMLKALGRPVEESPSDGDHSAGVAADDADLDGSIALDTTRIEPPTPVSSTMRHDSSVTAGRKRQDVAEERRGATHDLSSVVTGSAAQQVPAEDEFELHASIDLEPVETEEASSEIPPIVPQTRFTTVEEEELLKDRHRDGPHLLVQIAWVVGLAAAIGAIGWGVFYLMRPPTADALYTQITAEGGPEMSDNLLSLESTVDEFLKRFPDDDRSPEVAGYQKSIRLTRTERRLNKIAARGHGERTLLPAEQMYIRAIRLGNTRPHDAIRQLESILALYGADGPAGEGDAASETTAAVKSAASRERACLQLVRRRLAEYRRQEAARAEIHLPELYGRLRAADEVATTDRSAAREIYQAILELYADTPWAADVVEQARAALERWDLDDAGADSER